MGWLHMSDQTMFLLVIVVVLIIMFVVIFPTISDTIVDKLAKKNAKAREIESSKHNNVAQIIVLIVAICVAINCLSYVGEAIANEKDEIADDNTDIDNRVIEYYILNADEVLFSYADVSQLSNNELYYIRNGIYALHGKNFGEEELDKFYREFKWYSPQHDSADVVKELISSQEWELIEIIQKVEEERKIMN